LSCELTLGSFSAEPYGCSLKQITVAFLPALVITLGAILRKHSNAASLKHFVGKPEDRRPNWRHRLRWEGNIKMSLKEIG
jgi:hypothetical protein